MPRYLEPDPHHHSLQRNSKPPSLHSITKYDSKQHGFLVRKPTPKRNKAHISEEARRIIHPHTRF